MADLKRLRCTWGGAGVIGPGVSTFYSSATGVVGMADDVETFFSSSAAAFPNDVSITIPSGGDLIESTTGALSGSWNDPGTGGTVTGTDAGDFAQGVGVQVRWRTDGIVSGRRVVGSTFLVPIAGGIFDTDGTVDNASVAVFLTRATTLITAMDGFVIWSRPTPSRAGAISEVVSASVPDRVSWLRSRRT